MPWKEIRVEEQRLSIVREHKEGASISSLAESYDVSRKTIYKWLQRYEQQGLAGLSDLCRRPLHSPSQVSQEVEQAIVEARQRWKWGPRKLRVKLCQSEPKIVWPAVSTIASVLHAKGLVVSRRRRPRTPIQKPPYASPNQPNDVWCADFKGWFRTGDGTRVDPLPITDACSRYLLRCQIVERTNYEFARTARVQRAIPNVPVGSPRFWGEWFGRPCDHWPALVSCRAEQGVLLLSFGPGETLSVWSPRGLTLDDSTFRIADADRVRWTWFSYGLPQRAESLSSWIS